MAKAKTAKAIKRIMRFSHVRSFLEACMIVASGSQSLTHIKCFKILGWKKTRQSNQSLLLVSPKRKFSNTDQRFPQKLRTLIPSLAYWRPADVQKAPTCALFLRLPRRKSGDRTGWLA